MIISDYTDRYLNNYKNYKEYWNYEDGCVLTGCIKLFEATGDKKYSDFVLGYLSSIISEDGIIELSNRARMDYGATIPPRIVIPNFINRDYIRWRWENYNGI